MEYKQVILVRADLKLPKGKMSAQCSHASVEAVLRSDKELVKKWRAQGSKKVVLKVENLEELHKYNQMAKDIGLTTALITDAGKTVIAPGTETAVGIGPDEEERIDKITGNLKII
ncbi:peptidyl-tRNA hydrolase [Candidatus Woesearchaeota archaeon]|nr:peptidyl-tRNA hydrolase [Candidatus Woesearchaeota archaeon]